LPGINITGSWRLPEITEQIPDARIAWCTRSGERHAGVVAFHRINDHQTRVMLQMEYAPQGAAEKLGDMIGMFPRRVEQDLERFKEFIERRGVESGDYGARLIALHNPFAAGPSS
jgi:uncharacterized membrane protein